MPNNKLAINFLKNGLFALSFAGFYSIILVVLRTPFIAPLVQNPHIFRNALITHVNLSVLVWLLAITCSLWSLNNKSGYHLIYSYLILLSTTLIAVSPLFGGEPLMNNYIPILQNIVFVLGLSILLISILLFSFQNLLFFNKSLLGICSFTSSLMFIGVALCFIKSYLSLKDIINIIEIDIEYYYELLFWSAGHLIQFLYTQILMTIWVIILTHTLKKSSKFIKPYKVLLYINFLACLIGIIGHYKYDIIDGEFKEFYTNQMKYLGGICPIICLILIVQELITTTKYNNLYQIIITSAILFCSGGLIGQMINGINVTIPAHYHGMIVGISVALMGFSYLLIYNQNNNDFINFQTLNWSLGNEVSLSPLQLIQLWVITIGQLIHIGGLTLAGGYGALRKSTSMLISSKAKIGLGLMGIGGLCAITGGLMFVFICIHLLYTPLKSQNTIKI